MAYSKDGIHWIKPKFDVVSGANIVLEKPRDTSTVAMDLDDPAPPSVNRNGTSDLSSLAGKPVRFRFHLKDGSLYSFWVSPDQSGASHGYVAAGGPGFPGDKDTVGAAAYEAAKEITHHN